MCRILQSGDVSWYQMKGENILAGESGMPNAGVMSSMCTTRMKSAKKGAKISPDRSMIIKAAMSQGEVSVGGNVAWTVRQ
jgi:hypothetical protein